MTNPSFPHGHDTIDDGPRLPTADPVPSGQPAASQNGDEFAPYLPAPTPVAAPPVEPATFDAKAMVDGQKRVKTDPTYGALPQGSSEGREAARQLREQANRKRRRNRAIARAVAVTLLGVVAAGAYFGYRFYQDRQDDDAGAVGEVDGDADDTDDTADTDAAIDGTEGADGEGSGESSGDDGDGTSGARSAGAGLTPLGVIAEQLEAQATLNEAAPDGIVGGFIQAMDDARSVVDEINDRSQGATDLADELTGDATDDATGDGGSGTDGGTAAGGLTTLDAVVMRYDLAAPDAPVVQNIAADIAGDTYFVATTSDGEVLAAVETDAASHHQFDVAAGSFARAARGPLSLEPGPDGLFVAPISPRLVFPPSAVLHSTSIDIGLLDADGAPLLDTGYRIDVDGFLATAPDVASVWLELLLRADPTALPSIDPGTVEALTDVPADELSRIAGEAAEELAAPDAIDAAGAPEPAAGEAVVGWSVADNGLVDTLYLHLGDGRAHWLYQVDDFDAPAFGPVFGPVLAPT